MNEWLQVVLAFISGLVIGCLCGWFGHLWTVRREQNSRKRVFRDRVSCVISEIEAVTTDKLLATHWENLPKVREACAVVQEDISKRRRARFDRARKNYGGLKDEDVSYLNPEAMAVIQFKSGTTPPNVSLTDYERGRKRIVEALEELKGSAL